MKPFYLLFCCLLGGTFVAKAQDNGDQPAAATSSISLGFGFDLYDFGTARQIRTNSLAATFNNKRITKVSDMGPGISLHLGKALTPKVDFHSSLGFASANVTLEQDPARTRNASIIAADAGVHLKLLTDDYVVNPFVSAGLGATIIKGYYGAILPVGAGVRFRINAETFIGFQSQYRVAVTETAGYHFVHGITLMGKL